MKLKLTIVLITFLAMFSCFQGKDLIKPKPNPDGKAKILIGADATDLKNQIIKDLFNKYSDYHFDITDLKKFSKSDYTDYSVIILMDEVWAGLKLNKKLQKSLNRMTADDKKKLVLFITAGDPDYKYQYEDIDAITSASKIDKKDSLILEIQKEIDEILGVQK